MASYLLCWGGGALEDRYLYAPPYPAVYRWVPLQTVAAGVWSAAEAHG